YMDEFIGNSRFEIQRRLGAGGMGVVYKAYDHERKEIVALKTVRETDGELIYRFKNEFRLLADFLHPNFANLYELFSSDNHIFFTMEYIDGVSFDEHVRRVRIASPTTSGFDSS